MCWVSRHTVNILRCCLQQIIIWAIYEFVMFNVKMVKKKNALSISVENIVPISPNDAHVYLCIFPWQQS